MPDRHAMLATTNSSDERKYQYAAQTANINIAAQAETEVCHVNEIKSREERKILRDILTKRQAPTGCQGGEFEIKNRRKNNEDRRNC